MEVPWQLPIHPSLKLELESRLGLGLREESVDRCHDPFFGSNHPHGFPFGVVFHRQDRIGHSVKKKKVEKIYSGLGR